MFQCLKQAESKNGVVRETGQNPKNVNTTDSLGGLISPPKLSVVLKVLNFARFSLTTPFFDSACLRH